MRTNFQHVEEVLADQAFQNWFFKKEGPQAREWEEWLSNNPQHHDLVKQAVNLMNELNHQEKPVSPDLTENQWQLLNERLLNKETAPVVPMRHTTRKRWWLSAAAALLLLTGLFTVYKLVQPSTKKFDALYGEIATKQLPDGSTMILNANSTAKLSEGWTEGKDREVWLEGEAFFKVTKTAQKSRFIVHTANLDVIVTGTQFNVLHRNNKTTVLLTEGSVILRSADGKELAMKPGDYVEMDNQLVEKKEARPENVLAWRDSKIVFDNTPLSKAIQQIKDHYGVSIQLGDPTLADKRLTGILPNNDLDDLLEAIEAAAEIRIVKEGDDIILTR